MPKPKKPTVLSNGWYNQDGKPNPNGLYRKDGADFVQTRFDKDVKKDSFTKQKPGERSEEEKAAARRAGYAK